MSDTSVAQQVIDDFPRLLVEIYCIFASTALLWFDFSLTFTTEVRCIWRRKFSGATIVYLLTRYIALIERIFFVVPVLLWSSSDTTCAGLTHTDDVLTALNYLAFSAFTILRIYAVWGRDWKPLVIVVPLTLVKPALLIVEASAYTAFQSGPLSGCAYLYNLPDSTLARFSTIAKATTIASDAILIVLTWIKTFGISRDSARLGMRTPLATLLLRDGTAYFIVLLIIQIITIVSNQIGSDLTVWLVWPYFDQVLTVIILSRFMLNLRGLYFPDTERTTHALSSIRFTTSSNVVGNFGASLSTVRAYNGSHGGDDADEDDETRQAAESESESEEWYDDELPRYASDPFAVGMMKCADEALALAPSVPLLELDKDKDKDNVPIPPRVVVAVALGDVEASPVSPASPEQGASPV